MIEGIAARTGALGRTLNCRAAFGIEDLEARNNMEPAMRGVVILTLLCWS